MYLCIVPEEEQRHFYISLLSRIFGWNHIVSHILPKSDSFLLQLPFLFHSHAILHLHPIENISLTAKDSLYSFIQSYPSPILLSGASFGQCMDLYATHSESSLLIDLTQETKWEKKNRLKEYCLYEIERKGKSLTQDALEYLLQEREESIVTLQNEVDKVICQSGTNKTIQKADVVSLVSAGTRDDWKSREQIAFGLESEYKMPYLPKEFFPFLQQIRYLIDLAFLFLHARQSPDGAQALQKKFPHVKGNLTTHYATLLDDLPIEYCIQAKRILFETEYTAKSSAIPIPLVTQHLIAKLQCLRKNVQSL